MHGANVDDGIRVRPCHSVRRPSGERRRIRPHAQWHAPRNLASAETNYVLRPMQDAIFELAGLARGENVQDGARHKLLQSPAEWMEPCRKRLCEVLLHPVRRCRCRHAVHHQRGLDAVDAPSEETLHWLADLGGQLPPDWARARKRARLAD